MGRGTRPVGEMASDRGESLRGLRIKRTSTADQVVIVLRELNHEGLLQHHVHRGIAVTRLSDEVLRIFRIHGCVSFSLS